MRKAGQDHKGAVAEVSTRKPQRSFPQVVPVTSHTVRSTQIEFLLVSEDHLWEGIRFSTSSSSSVSDIKSLHAENNVARMHALPEGKGHGNNNND